MFRNGVNSICCWLKAIETPEIDVTLYEVLAAGHLNLYTLYVLAVLGTYIKLFLCFLLLSNVIYSTVQAGLHTIHF